MDLTRIPVRTAEVLEAEVDGDRVLMSVRDYSYYGLTTTGALVWERIDGKTALADLVHGLAEQFGADESRVHDDVAGFISALDAAGLLDS